MNTAFNHLINNRPLTTFRPISQECALAGEKNYLFDLAYKAVIEVSGEKSTEFLQGQLSCDVTQISDIQIAQGAQCSLQGRILALLDIIDWQGIKLVLPQDLVEATIKSLSKTAMLSRVTLKANSQLKVFGFYLQNPDDILPGAEFFPDSVFGLTYGAGYCCYHLGQGFYILLASPELAENITKDFANNEQLLGSLTWHTLRLAQRQLEIYPESRSLFLPHRLDLHQTPYINFNKGCYKGQEIIARMHYKSTLKHQLAIYSLTTDEKIYSGQKLFNASGNAETGELVDFSILANGTYLVAVSILKTAEPLVLLEGHKEHVTLKPV